MTYHDQPRNIAQLLADVFGQFTQLFQSEIRLAKAEISDTIAQAGNAGVMIGAGAVALLVALFLLLQSLVLWLAVAGLPERWGYLLVGVLIAAAGVAVLLVGIGRAKAVTLVPNRTIDQVSADIATVKEQIT
jgi:hypothetical protein